MLNPPFHPRFSRSQRSPAVTKGGTLYYPFWLAAATGVLEKDGFDCLLLDAPARGFARGEVLSRAADFSPDIVVCDTSTPSIYNDAEVAESLKETLPRAFVVLTGTHPTALPEETLALAPRVDAVALGEYDYTLRDLARRLKAGGDPAGVAGLCIRRGGICLRTAPRPLIEDLDELPFVSETYRKHLDIRDYYFAAADYPVVQIISARGCPQRCFFCVYPQTFHGRRFRPRSPENVAAEFAFIAANLPEAREIGLEDDTFTVDRGRARRICELLVGQRNRLKWYTNVRADLEYETLAAMKEAGCRLVTVGFESGSQELLNRMKKGLRLGQSRAFVKNARRAGILVHGCIMVGNPGETRETMAESLRFAKELACDSFQFYPLIVYPGTEAYAWAKAHGYLLTEDYSKWMSPSLSHASPLSLPGISMEEMERFCERAYRSYHFNPRYLARKLVQSALRPSEGRRNLRSARRYAAYLARGLRRRR